MSVCRVITVVLAAWTLSSAAADDASVSNYFHGKTVRFLVGTPAGGSYDAVTRVLTRYLGDHIPGKPSIVVENIPGAASLIMTNYLYNKAPQDGTAMGMPTSALPFESKLKILSSGGGEAMFDTSRINWIGTPAQQPEVLFVDQASIFYKFDDLKRNKLIIAATSPGADPYILPLMTKRLLGANIEIVPGYKGGPEMLLAIERGEAQGAAAPISFLTANDLLANKVRIILQFGPERSHDIPNIPTAAEFATSEESRAILRFYGLKSQMAYPIMLPPNVPADRVAALRQAFDLTMTDPAYKADAARIGLDVSPLSGDQMTKLVEEVNAAPEAIASQIRELLSGPQN